MKVSGVIFRNGDKVLLMRRAAGQPLAGEWEFPGGKFECNETGPECLHRELSEELGIDAKIGEQCATATITTDNGKTIELYVYEILSYTGDIELRVHDLMEWVNLSDLPVRPKLPAEKIISEQLKTKGV